LLHYLEHTTEVGTTENNEKTNENDVVSTTENIEKVIENDERKKEDDTIDMILDAITRGKVKLLDNTNAPIHFYFTFDSIR
jgi:hypothetical protein